MRRRVQRWPTSAWLNSQPQEHFDRIQDAQDKISILLILSVDVK